MTVVIRGGTVVDGTGAAPRRADVVIEGERVVAIGPDAASSAGDAEVIDAAGMLVTPGFVDLHTHYDAQLSWDANASPSPLHGVTTVLGGNCGFSLAPLGPEHADYISRMMARVEGMPLAALRAGLPWDWTSFGEWLDRLDGRVAVNAGFLVGHSTLRRLVMGERAVGGEATPEDVAAMVAALHAALDEGALGFSTSQVHTHNDGDGQPVPSRAASRAEMERLAAAVRDHPGTTLELIVAGCLNGFTEEETDFIATMSLLADRPVNWNVLGVSSMNPDGAWSQLATGTAAADRGATVVALTLPHTMQIRLSFEHGAILDGLPGWREVFALPFDERIAAFSNPETRRRLDAGAHSDEAGILRHLAVWERLIIEETFASENKAFEGRTVGEVAAEQRRGAPSTRCSTWWWPTGCAPACGHRSASPRRTGCYGPRSGRTRAPSSGGPTRAPTSTRCAAPSTPRRCWATACAPAGCSAGSGPSSCCPTCRRGCTGCVTGAASFPAPTPTSWCSTPPPSGTRRCARATTCRAAPAGSTPRRPASGACS